VEENMRKNKYNLMGQYVKVKAYLKPAKKFSAREHMSVILEHPRIGMVVGYRTVYDGKIHPGSNQSGYSLDPDYSPPWFEVTGTIEVLLVCFWPRYKPVYGKKEDIMILWAPHGGVTSMLHPTTYKWSDKDKDYLREEIKNMPRDEKGRWKA
jgi:hypothetical protein